MSKDPLNGPGKIEFAVLEVAGPQAEVFLQGQVTADVLSLSAKEIPLTGCCDQKGRLVANFWMIKESSQRYFLMTPASMLEILSTHLKKYAVFSKVVLKYLDNIQLLVNDLNLVNKSSPSIIQNFILKNVHLQLSLTTQEELPTLQNDVWKNFLITNGIVFIYPATSGLFIPQMINLQIFGGISFTKGCYLGQEIVARTQHLGILKRHLYRGNSNSPVSIGAEISDSKNQTVGIVAECVSDNNESRFLAVIEDRAQNENLKILDNPITIVRVTES